MKVLVVGAGVIGSFNAARLVRGGVDVTLLARGERLAVLHDMVSYWKIGERAGAA
jgi:2-dehydropantoate 2-reductase